MTPVRRNESLRQNGRDQVEALSGRFPVVSATPDGRRLGMRAAKYSASHRAEPVNPPPSIPLVSSLRLSQRLSVCGE